MSAVWSLSGGKRTWRLRAPTSEIDPTRNGHHLNDVLAKPGTFLNFGHLGLIKRLRLSPVQLAWLK